MNDGQKEIVQHESEYIGGKDTQLTAIDVGSVYSVI
jgi:hypothetical protein